ncbi:MAG: AAA family ATPase [Pirellula sp.]
MGEPSQPTIYILAGPNGAGKTTFANAFLQKFANCREFLNADLIAAGLAPFAPETQAIRASELLLSRIRELAAASATFSFETTLAARSYRTSILEWQRLGYRVVLYFIWLRSAEMAIERVAGRVQQGGHHIPEDVVRRRYTRGLTNLFDLYLPIVSNAYVFDGTAFPPILVAEIEGENTLVLDYTRWKLIARERMEASHD